MAKPLDLMLVGATGVVGTQVLALALADSRFAKVVAPTRRPLPANEKLLNPVVDFNALPADAPWWKVDAVICTLGTTIRAAESQAAFAAVDLELPVRIGRFARQAGATHYALNSSMGASHKGNFYLRTKAQAETALRAIGYPFFTIVRPSLIDAKREHARLLESAGIVLMRALGPLIPRRYRVVKPDRIARALIEGALTQTPGENIVESEHL